MIKKKNDNKYKMRSNYALFINPESAQNFYVFFDSQSYHLDRIYQSTVETSLYTINS